MKGYNMVLRTCPSIIKHGSIEKCPPMAIGTYQRSYEELLEIISAYPYDAIILDTAYRYGNEVEVGEAIKTSGYPLQNVIIIGKICFEQQRRSTNVRDEVLGTLMRLGVDVIDFYLIHSPRYENYVETWLQLIELNNEGLIRNIGVSNFGISEINKLYEKSGVLPAVNQVVYNSFAEEKERLQIIQYCKSKGIDTEVASPFGGSEKQSCLSDLRRSEILVSLYNQGVLSVVGTSNKEHMLKNYSIYEELECEKKSY